MSKFGISALKTFVHEVKVELVKCSWPTREELMESTIVVIVSVIILGFFVGISDTVLMHMLKLIVR